MYVVLFGCFAVIISYIDLKTYRIPDGILLIYFLLKTCLDIRIGNAFMQFDQFAAGLLAFLLFYTVFRSTKGLGFGDVKYATIIGYTVGIRLFFVGTFIASILGMIVFFVGFRLLDWDMKRKLPFAPFLSAGALFTFVIK
ncbi:MAG TPA: prepilin peptidase [Treponema sp.]|nr:prepilin peptidase [Treponema sp.]